MTRPEIIRADTIDLQNHDAPSAQRHHRPPLDGSLAPHQAETIREVAAEAAEENLRSPLVSRNGDPVDSQQQTLNTHPTVGGTQNGSGNIMPLGAQTDALAIAQNGGISGHEADDGDLDGDTEVDMDDDMDRISSSPSIADGGSTLSLPNLCSSRPGPSSHLATWRSQLASPSVSDPRSSSPYLESPDHFPLRRTWFESAQSPSVPISSRHHHHLFGESEVKGTTKGHTSTEICTPPGNGDYEDDGLGLDEKRGARAGNGRKGPHLTAREELPAPRPLSCEHEEEESDELIIPYESADYEDDDGDDDDGDSAGVFDSRFIDSGWGGECLQNTEDIDFEFVYALHTFVATVEGQANATKGDTMVLLDDSNSYWWLVRVVKDSSIGYLPAEHIETPTERLARLNKHRNVDLSASMLTDQTEKGKPKRSAMKRRKAKTVQFAAPTYVDYSDVDYSTDGEDAEADNSIRQQQEQQQRQQQQQQQSQESANNIETEDESAKVEPLKPRSQAKIEAKDQEDGGDTESLVTSKAASRISEETTEVKSSDGPKKRSDGIVRDSFFKDDTVETKKITLTPNLLRDDDGSRTSSDSRDVKQRPSLDRLDKDNALGKDDKKKKKDKDKDKKTGGIRGFFSRKDKKVKGDEDDDSLGKRSMDADAPEKEIEDEEAQAPSERAAPQRHPSKLQKQQPRTEPSPTRKTNGAKESGLDIKAFLSEGKVNNVANVPPASMRLVESSPRAASPEGSSGEQRLNRDASPGGPRSTSLKAPRGEARPQKTVQAKARVELDDFDSDEDVASEPTRQAPTREDELGRQQRSLPAGAEQKPQLAVAAMQTEHGGPPVATPAAQLVEGLSESPVQVSPTNSGNPPPLMVDSSSQEEERTSPRSTPSPELIEHEDANTPGHKDSMTSATTARSSWDDASLRAFFDSGSDVRDLLVLVYDKNNVDMDPSDHPVASSLFREQNAKLAEITTRLDDMLGDWLARKQRLRGAV